MKILLLEPFYTGSHKKWADEFQNFSKHEIEILSMGGHHWKWRMHGGAVTFSQIISSKNISSPDVILATDMLDLSLFLSLTRNRFPGIPSAVYFHENQLNYPWSPDDKDKQLQRDNHYAFINYTSALAADRIFFNSQYHHNTFLNELPKFLQSFPDYNNIETVETIRKKSSVLPLAMDLKKFDSYKVTEMEKPNQAVVLWNHRWEYDKNPDFFFRTLFKLQEHGIDFKLIVLGEKYDKCPPIFYQAKEKLADKILHFGYAENFSEYSRWLSVADVLPVTSHQDFFGGSVIEAMYNNVIPLLPKRLAYPEHIPTNFHSAFFYDEADFAAKLQRRIMDVKYLRGMDTRQYAAKYDWSNVIATYDKEIEKLAAQSV